MKKNFKEKKMVKGSGVRYNGYDVTLDVTPSSDYKVESGDNLFMGNSETPKETWDRVMGVEDVSDWDVISKRKDGGVGVQQRIQELEDVGVGNEEIRRIILKEYNSGKQLNMGNNIKVAGSNKSKGVR